MEIITLVLSVLFLYFLLQVSSQAKGSSPQELALVTSTLSTVSSSAVSTNSTTSTDQTAVVNSSPSDGGLDPKTEDTLFNLAGALALSVGTLDPLPLLGFAVSTMLEYAEDDHGPTPEEQLAAVIDDLAGEINGVTLMTLGIQQAIDELEAQLKTAVAFGSLKAQMDTLSPVVSTIRSNWSSVSTYLQQGASDVRKTGQVGDSTQSYLLALLSAFRTQYSGYLSLINTNLISPPGRGLLQFTQQYYSLNHSQYSGSLIVPLRTNGLTRFVTSAYLSSVWAVYYYYQTAEIMGTALEMEGQNANVSNGQRVSNTEIQLNSDQLVKDPTNKSTTTLFSRMNTQLSLMPRRPFQSTFIVWDTYLADVGRRNLIWAYQLLTVNNQPGTVYSTSSSILVSNACRGLGNPGSVTNAGNTTWMGEFANGNWMVPQRSDIQYLMQVVPQGSWSLSVLQALGLCSNATPNTQVWAFDDITNLQVVWNVSTGQFSPPGLGSYPIWPCKILLQ